MTDRQNNYLYLTEVRPINFLIGHQYEMHIKISGLHTSLYNVYNRNKDFEHKRFLL